jgi:DNA polymerase-1
MPSRPTFFIIDGHALAYRQYFALPVASFSTRAGEPTNAVYGFARTLLDILQRDKPDYIAVSFDAGLSGRDQLYGEYKGTRDKMPDDLSVQIDRIIKLVEAFNMPVLSKEGYEADDVIGTVVGQAEAEGVEVRIITGDRDMLQLLSDHISAQIPVRKGNEVFNVLYDMAKFREEYGFEPWQLVEYKALFGDTSDNIPGVKGIGDKTATALIQQYGSIDGIYEHIDDIKGAMQKKLVEGKDSAYLSRHLAKIQRDVPITIHLPACAAHDYDVNQVDALFGELEFRSLRDRLPKSSEQLSLFDAAASEFAAPPPPADPLVTTVIVQDAAGLEALAQTLNNASAIAFDTETTSTDQMLAELVGISLAVDGDTGYYIPVGHQTGEQLPLQTVMDALRPALTNPAIPKYGHNAVYDVVVLGRNGVDVSPVTFDTMVAEWLRNPESKFLGLKNLARQELNVQMTEITDLIGTGKKQITMNQVAIEQAAPYAAADAVITYRLVEFERPELAKAELVSLFEDLEMPLVPVISSMERAGVVLDTHYLSQLGERMGETLAGLEARIYEAGGSGPFNINSPKQLNDVLFEKLKLPVEGLRKTTHGYSTDAAVLESLRDAHPIVPLLIEYREISKLKSTYVDALPLLINPHTGRVHTSYNQTGAATGRISSSNPNLQNIPIRTELGREVRRAFVAPKGAKLLSVDYSQIELRILAHVSGDQTLLDAFAQGQDIHAATAAAVFSIPLDQVTKEQRSFAKRVNFGIIYGMGAFRLARDSELTLAQAREFIETYFARLPQVEAYLEGTKQQARKGPIQTLFGRKRIFPTLLNAGGRGNAQAVNAEERVAINMPIQGTAADIMKRAMTNLYHELNRSGLKGRMILQVHDELVLEVPEAEVADTRDLTVRVMEDAYELRAPLRANAQVGDNWNEMTPI